MKSGDVTILTDKFEGKRYNSPNDVCVDTKGRVWFTDPYYGPDRSGLEMDVDGVYRIDPTLTASGKESVRVTRVLTQKEIDRPTASPSRPTTRRCTSSTAFPSSAAIARSGPSTSRKTARSPSDASSTISAKAAAATA